VRAEAAWLVGEPSTLRQAPFDPFGYAQGRQGSGQAVQAYQDKFFFSLTIAAILYKYMHIYLCSALRIVVFERGI